MVKSVRKKKLTALLCLAAMSLSLLAGCGESKGDGGLFTKKQELPEDTPWNHGQFAIMETEQGWYTSSDGGETICLRYYDKESGKSIFLCNKPECTHDERSENCEATYKNLRVVNALLYEGAIYVLGYDLPVDYSGDYAGSKDMTVNLSLYKAAMDGSAMDHVATIIEAENTKNQQVKRTSGVIQTNNYSDNRFIIHKGYAYIPYMIQFGGGQAGLRGAGLMRVELSTGKTEQIYEKDTMAKGLPGGLAGVGDYVYYYSNSTGADRGWNRYNVSDKTMENLYGWLGAADYVKDGRHFSPIYFVSPMFTEDRIYYPAYTYDEADEGRTRGMNGLIAVVAFDAKTGEVLEDESFETELPYQKYNPKESRVNGANSFTYYDGNIMIANSEGAYFYDKSGKQIAKILIPKEEFEITDMDRRLFEDYKICNDKLYLIYLKQQQMTNYEIYQCPLADIFQGNGTWTFAYYMEGRLTREKLQEIMQQQVQ